jgi:putative hydrolase of the HAD superfamily
MSRPVGGVLFDLGGTLASYYHADEFRSVLERCVRHGLDELTRRGRTGAQFESVLAAAVAQKEAPDFRVRPLAPRLASVYAVPLQDAELLDALCAAFLKPIFALGRCFDDTLPVLAEVRATGVRTAIVSNSPWGSSAALWRQELRRLQLHDVVDVTVFCGDVGWRKPAKAIFDHAAHLIDVPADRCVFIGDDPQWDAEGATNAGMRPILIDRDERHPQAPWPRARTLWEVAEHLTLMQNSRP